MPKSNNNAAQRGTMAQADERIVHVLEQTVEAEVLKRIEAPLRDVVHEAVLQAIVAASRVDTSAKPPRRAPKAPAASRASAPSAEAHRPKDGGRCAAVWEELDRLRNGNKEVPKLQDIMTIGKRKRWNENNTRVEYYQWRKFNGIQGRLPS